MQVLEKALTFHGFAVCRPFKWKFIGQELAAHNEQVSRDAIHVTHSHLHAVFQEDLEILSVRIRTYESVWFLQNFLDQDYCY